MGSFSVPPGSQSISRRSLLMAGASIMASSAVSYGRIPGANDRISLGHVGIGNRGRELGVGRGRAEAAHNVEMIAVCDLWKSQSRARRQDRGRRIWPRAPRPSSTWKICWP